MQRMKTPFPPMPVRWLRPMSTAALALLLGLFPAWLRWLPRPGRWMETFRQVLAFPMYATAAWLACRSREG